VTDPKAVLEALLAHPLLRGAVADRPRRTYRDGASPREQYGPGIRAIQAVPTWPAARDLVGLLGRLRYIPAVPTLAKLWQYCPVVPVVQAAAHALFQIGTPEAHAALQTGLEEREHLSTFVALKSIVSSDSHGAFDRLERYLAEDALTNEGGRVIAGEILRFFGPASYSREGRDWHLPGIPALLREDPRWVQTAVRLRRHPKVGADARHLLETLERDEVEAALRRWPDPPPEPRPVHVGARDFLARYERGEHEAVWRELFALGRLTDDLRQEATTVALATMARVRTNVELVTARLRAVDYPFDDFLPAWSPPAPDVVDHIRKIEEATGAPVPVSLEAFWVVVGEVSWKYAEEADGLEVSGSGGLNLAEADPLYVLSPDNAWGSVEAWVERRERRHPEVVGPLSLDLAPDYLHKANISGGAAYAILLPHGGADAILENEEHELPFVEYLRLCFAWGGFPRLERAELSEEGRAFVERLRKDLLPF
jgi:hypothetical protein